MIAGTNNVEGSPPHGRGKVDTISNNSRARRITPAWAGKSHASLYCNRVEGDHPRMGGEKLPRCGSVYPWQGSPPHGRGKGGKLSGRVRPKGITPAWAGKSMTAPGRSSRTGDHPRVGGEKAPAAGHCSTDTGSPPHRRGKGPALHCSSPVPGITPAWAGKSPGRCYLLSAAQDHPRVGGEKSGIPAAITLAQGSPPRGRGKGLHRGDPQPFHRITPAWAGKSSDLSSP